MTSLNLANSTTDSGELFYPITKADVIKLSKLTPAAFKIYLYLKTLDPFGNQILEINLEALQKDLEIKSLGTVYPALGLLHREKLINLVSRNVHVHVPGSSGLTIEKLKNRSIFRSKDQKIDQKIKKLKNRELEPADSGDFEGSKIIRSNRFKRIERIEDICENDSQYLEFVRNRVNLLPNKPAFPDEVIEKQARKKSTKKAYLQHLETQARVTIPQPALSPREFREQRIITLKAMWERGEWQKVQEMLKSHADWEITLDDLGVNDDEPEL